MRFLYVFDLDGTLANTADLSSGRRTPHLLLDDDPLDTSLAVGPERWALENELGVDMSAAPGQIRAAGHWTAVITRSPRAYASTLAGLLGLERMPIWPSTSTGVPDKLRALANRMRIPLDRVVYVGDTGEDRAAARTAGCHFRHVHDFELPDGPDFEDPDEIDEDSVLSVVTSLAEHPQHRRLELQARLSRLVTPEHRYCLVQRRSENHPLPGAFTEAGLPAYLFTRDERRGTYLTLLRNLFPAYRTSRVRRGSGDSYYICGYVKLGQEGMPDTDPLGGLLRVMKNYRRTSGPEVELGSLPLVSDVLASHFASWFGGFKDIDFWVDHVAPNEFSETTPGRVSSWLARLVSMKVNEALETGWQPVASTRRSRAGIEPNPVFDGVPVWAVLIDDQRTTGSSLGRHIDRSNIPEWETTLTWSDSNPPIPTAPSRDFARTTPGCFWPDLGPCPFHGASEFTNEADDVPF